MFPLTANLLEIICNVAYFLDSRSPLCVYFFPNLCQFSFFAKFDDGPQRGFCNDYEMIEFMDNGYLSPVIGKQILHVLLYSGIQGHDSKSKSCGA